MKLLKWIGRKSLLVFLTFLLLGAEVTTRLEPRYDLEAHKKFAIKIEFDRAAEVWWIYDKAYVDSWMWRLPREELNRLIANMEKPYPIPGETKYDLKFKKLEGKEPEKFFSEMMAFAAMSKKRVVLINPESNDGLASSVKIFGHLGLLNAGTVAEQEECEVLLIDELIDDPINIANVIKPNDIVGISFLVTNVERGLEMARQAKAAGASCIIAGGSTAAFRDDQLLKNGIDVVFTSNSVKAIRSFFQQFEGNNLATLDIPHLKTVPGGTQRSNRKFQLLSEKRARQQQRVQGEFDNDEVFIVPNLNLFPQSHWEQAWAGYQQIYGHKYRDPSQVRNSLIHMAQGCTRTQGVDVCSYCTIPNVADVRIPSHAYLVKLLDAYAEFGITEYFNVTDSSYEMVGLLGKLEDIGASFDSLTLYGRAQGIATHPQLLERWMKLTRSGRVMINVGFDSWDEKDLTSGVGKSSIRGLGSRVKENYQAVLEIKKAGAHLHNSIIFGIPAATIYSSQVILEKAAWVKDTLGIQLDMQESDLYWLNFGSPISELFYSHSFAQALAAKAGKEIGQADWWKHFGSRTEDLVVSWSSEVAYYEYFTQMTIEQAQECNQALSDMMATHEAAIPSRAYYPKLTEE